MPQGHKLSLLELVGLVIGAIIGGGVFNIMHDIAVGAGPGAVIIGWIITAVGMLSLAFTFQNLTQQRSDLDAGVFSYAEAGFGKYMGFNSAWGYWLSTLLGTVGYATLLMSAVAYFLPIFGNGQNIWSILVASVVLWGCHFMILRGIESASFINVIITIAKLIPIFLFILIMIISFRLNIFTADFWFTNNEHFELNDVLSQVRSTMLVTVWVFIGIEGAVVFSSRAKKRSDVGKATVLGLSIVILIYMLITLLSFGVMKQSGLSHLSQPAMAALLEKVVGKWGAIVVNLGLIISVAGAWLSFTMFAGQLPYEAAKVGTFPKFFTRDNQNGAPVNSLIVTNVVVQLFMFTFLFTSSAYNLFYSIASSAILIPYAFSAFYQLKYSIQTDRSPKQIKNIIIGVVASVYTCWLLFSAGIHFILLISILFMFGIPVFYYLQKYDNHHSHIFKWYEKIIALAILILGIYSLLGLFLGYTSFSY
ncbi:arginine-ornithine antiporter [Nicoliella spurrieriana]|uniref:Arginine-ornithine antiporter n=1 Tax=Nicoliella spurrieriana TaxID=2925830 RepID=A0A976RRH4_9LACO|nr:arginine-ornithine antiporter [Nicoliella spurrieriana]UQS86453.1 arginine-ornithine antiporter [Nicoliella spurrieriana]